MRAPHLSITQPRVQEVLAANLEKIQDSFVRDVTNFLGEFLSCRFQLDLPSVGGGLRAAELLVVRSFKRVGVVAAVDDAFEPL